MDSKRRKMRDRKKHGNEELRRQASARYPERQMTGMEEGEDNE